MEKSAAIQRINKPNRRGEKFNSVERIIDRGWTTDGFSASWQMWTCRNCRQHNASSWPSSSLSCGSDNYRSATPSPVVFHRSDNLSCIDWLFLALFLLNLHCNNRHFSQIIHSIHLINCFLFKAIYLRAFFVQYALTVLYWLEWNIYARARRMNTVE